MVNCVVWWASRLGLGVGWPGVAVPAWRAAGVNARVRNDSPTHPSPMQTPVLT